MSLSRSLPAGDVFKARLILMLASGQSYANIRRRLQTTSPTISHWKKRFLEDHIAGLDRSPASWPETHRNHAQVASPRARGHAPPTKGRLDPLVGPQTRAGVAHFQRCSPSDLAQGRCQTAPVGAVHGQ